MGSYNMQLILYLDIKRIAKYFIRPIWLSIFFLCFSGGLVSGAEILAKERGLLIVDNGLVQPGSTVAVDVRIQGVSYMAGGRVDITYDQKYLKPVLSRRGAALTGFSFYMFNPVYSANSLRVVWSGSVNIGIREETLFTLIFEVAEFPLEKGEERDFVLEISDQRIFYVDSINPNLIPTMPMDVEDGIIRVVGPVSLSGDVNGDGIRRIGDAVMLLRSIVKIILLDQLALNRADVNGDRRVNIIDAVLLLRIIAGFIH